MTNSFSSKIKGIQAKMNQLKTLGLSSSSSLAVKEKTFTVSFKVVPTRGNPGDYLNCGSKNYAIVKITTKNNQAALLGLRLLSPTSFGSCLIAVQKVGANSSSAKFQYQISIIGGESELQTLNNGGSFSTVDYNFKIVATSDFSISIEYKDWNWS